MARWNSCWRTSSWGMAVHPFRPPDGWTVLACRTKAASAPESGESHLNQGRSLRVRLQGGRGVAAHEHHESTHDVAAHEHHESTYDVAVVGCGLMGAALARRFAASGLRVAAWNRTYSRAEALASDGVIPVESV